MKHRYLFHIIALFIFAILFGCSNDGAIQTENIQSKDSVVATKVTFVTEEPVVYAKQMTRTTISHQINNGATSYWSAGDKIWVKSTDGSFQQSGDGAFNSAKTRGVFALSGTFVNGCAVNYTGTNGTSGDKVTISEHQRQSKPNDFSHAGVSGDCGSASASGDRQTFKFKLNHKASYLCFLPRSSNKYVNHSILTKIEVISEDAIAGVYDFSTGTLSDNPISNSSKTITLTIDNGFPITNTLTDISANGAYVVIAPGVHHLAIRYWLKNTTDNPEGVIEGTVTKYVDLICKAGEIYDITANLAPQDISREYYMWDARKDYWYGNESSQPKVCNIPNDNYPKGQAEDPERWYYAPGSGFNWAANSATQCANVNQMLWYAHKGDPHWDADELWSLLGHLYKGGMWLKKQTVIASENGTTAQNMYAAAYDGSDYRNATQQFSEYFSTNNSIIGSRPTKSRISDYFYLPAKGFYYDGKLQHVGRLGYYWSATGVKNNITHAFSLAFSSNSVSIGNNVRSYGFSEELKW